MADQKLSELTSLTNAQSDDADLILVTDTSETTSKSMTLSEADSRFGLKSADITGQTAGTVAAGDLFVGTDVDDSNNLKKFTASSIAALGDLTWSTWSLSIGGGGSLTTTISNAQYATDGKLLICVADILQTAAGSGTDALTFSVPTGTVLDNESVGTASGFDIGNDNVYSVHGIEAINSTNVFQVRRNAAGTYIRGGTMIGNNSVANLNLCIVARLS